MLEVDALWSDTSCYACDRPMRRGDTVFMLGCDDRSIAVVLCADCGGQRLEARRAVARTPDADRMAARDAMLADERDMVGARTAAPGWKSPPPRAG